MKNNGIEKSKEMRKQKYVFFTGYLFIVLSFIFLLFPSSPSLNLGNGQLDLTKKKAVFNNQVIDIPLEKLALASPSLPVLSATTSNKRIEIDLTNQRIYAYERNQLIYNFLISSGKWGRTPTGTFKIWIKLRYAKMSGGSKTLNTYYYLPNVPFIMYFYNARIPKYRGFGIHGTYWHDNFGHPMSHGCINMKTEEVAQLYYWAQPELNGKSSILANNDNPGTTIIIYGQAPQ